MYPPLVTKLMRLLVILIFLLVFGYIIGKFSQKKRQLLHYGYYNKIYFMIIIPVYFGMVMIEMNYINDFFTGLLFILFLLTNFSFLNYTFMNLKVFFGGIQSMLPKDDALPVFETYPSVAFILPSCNEAFDVCKMTFDSVAENDYPGPKVIIVVDNSPDTGREDYLNWKTFVETYPHSERLTAYFWYNPEKNLFKPGNIDLAIRNLPPEVKYVVLLDIDSTLPRKENIIRRSLGYFQQDETLGIIQYQIIPTNLCFNRFSLVASINMYQYRLRHWIDGEGGFPFFLGHNAIWRREVLDRIGDWTESYKGQIIIAEDLLKSIAAYNQGYYSKTLWIKTGEWVPNSLNAFESMWRRWTFGTAQVTHKYSRKVFGGDKLIVYEKFNLFVYLLNSWSGPMAYAINLLAVLNPPSANSVAVLLLFSTGFIPVVLLSFVEAINYYRLELRKIKLRWFRKLWYVYLSIYVLRTFINYAQFMSLASFYRNKHFGWRVTAKGYEGKKTVWKVIRERYKFLSFHLAWIVLLGVLLVFDCQSYRRNQGNINVILVRGLSLFYFINLTLGVILFGSEGRTAENTVERATVDTYKDQNLMDF